MQKTKNVERQLRLFPPTAPLHWISVRLQTRVRLVALLARLCASSSRAPSIGTGAMSEKIQSQHLARKAVLYVKQSSAFQVLHNQESQKLQYAMQARLRDLGFTNIGRR